MIGLIDGLSETQMNLVQQVKSSANCNYDHAMKALICYNWDLSEAIMALTQ